MEYRLDIERLENNNIWMHQPYIWLSVIGILGKTDQHMAGILHPMNGINVHLIVLCCYDLVPVDFIHIPRDCFTGIHSITMPTKQLRKMKYGWMEHINWSITHNITTKMKRKKLDAYFIIYKVCFILLVFPIASCTSGSTSSACCTQLQGDGCRGRTVQRTQTGGLPWTISCTLLLPTGLVS